ncbi:MAG: toxin-antitoxin system HicB family antitoxin [Clostridiales bacterium]|nr:toxin-antitoxin system HicB family antitoxin [Clostridiales bacterium]
MRKKISPEELERRLDEINAREPEEPTKEDLEAIAKAEEEDPSDTISLKEFKAQKEYSGRLLLRIPKELHRELAQAAQENGVSLNQYALYKLSK